LELLILPACIILAAGEGLRMKSEKPKVLSEVLFYPMLGWVLDTVKRCQITEICIVAGYRSDLLCAFLSKEGYECDVAIQRERKGTAHAVMAASNFLESHINDDILILNGDSPFVSRKVILEAQNVHKNGNSATVVSSVLSRPFGYGKIIRDKNGVFCGIIEEKEANEKQKAIKEINSGIYWFKSKSLLEFLGKIKKQSEEYYLTSIFPLMIEEKLNVSTYVSINSESILGANTPEQLADLNRIAKMKVIGNLKSNGVYVPYEESIIVGKNVEIGKGTAILSDVTILGETKIGRNCIIGPGTNIFGGNFPDNTNLIFQDMTSQNHDLVKKNSLIQKMV
jgi:bifunctional UDP-N-acetylglucosamine pyrophosphorylase/glucosamine-1-phosphate N-acetyltransferase